MDYNVKQISSFIYAFKGEIFSKLKNIYHCKPPLLWKKAFLFRLHSSTFVYTYLHSSTLVQWLVYTRLHSSSDSSTPDYIFLHSSTLVYTRLVTRLCF